MLSDPHHNLPSKMLFFVLRSLMMPLRILPVSFFLLLLQISEPYLLYITIEFYILAVDDGTGPSLHIVLTL